MNLVSILQSAAVTGDTQACRLLPVALEGESVAGLWRHLVLTKYGRFADGMRYHMVLKKRCETAWSMVMVNMYMSGYNTSYITPHVYR